MQDIKIGFSILQDISPLSEFHLSYPYGRYDAIPWDFMTMLKVSYPSIYAWTLGNYISHSPSNNHLLLPRITPNEFPLFQSFI